jgi:sulfur-oxidizing protein SoxY
MAMALTLGSPSAQQAEETWVSLRGEMFGTRAVAEDGAFVALDAPSRAEDAALVPVDIHVSAPPGDVRRVVAVTLVVDENPAPLAAVFKLDGSKPRFDLSTRMRVNSYSFVRVVAEVSDGSLHMAKAFVKAAGGCSAPAVKDPAEAKANLGRMRFRMFDGEAAGEAQIQIRHPNYSGMQMDQVTRLYTPAWYVARLSVRQGGKPLFSMEGGISLSEDPTFRFSYEPNGGEVEVEATDTEGNHFRQSFAAS